MAVLLIAEHDNASLKDATHKALTAAAQDGRRRACAGGRQQGRCRRRPGRQAGRRQEGAARRESPALERPLAEPMAALIVSLAPAYDHLVAAATTNGKNYMPRVAALLDVMQISDISDVKSRPTPSCA